MTEKTRKTKTQPSRRSGNWRPETVNEEERTAELVFTTGADVVRADLFSGEKYVERLKVDEEAVDLERLQAGAPLLDNHDQLGSVRNVLGVVEEAWVEDGLGLARVRFSERADDVFADVRDGILRKVSVGYKHLAKREAEEDAGGLPVHEITRWQPMELSLVTVPADNGAQVRKAIEMEQNKADGVEINHVVDTNGTAPPTSETRAENTATWPGTTTTEIYIGDPQSGAGVEAVDEEAVRAAERERATEILEACEAVGLDGAFGRSLVAEGLSLEVARGRIINAIADKEGDEVDHRIEPGDGAREKEFSQLAAEGLAHRAGLVRSEDEAVIRQSYKSFGDVARTCAVMDGKGASHDDPHALATRAVTSTTLADTVALTAGRALGLGYEGEDRPFTRVFREATAQNFQDIMRVKLSDAPALALVAEGADYTEGTLSDLKETYSLSTYGKLLAITRQMIVNDDLDALTRIPMQMGAAAARKENDVVWTDTLLANGNMADGTAIYAAGRGNHVTSTALSAAAIEAARAHFRAVTAPQGTILNVVPVFLAVGEDLETTAEKLLAPPSAYSTATAGDVLSDRLRGQLSLVVEPRIPTGEWFLFASTSQIDTMEYAYLGSRRGAYVEQEVAFINKNLQLTVTDDFGAGAIDWRGIYHGQAGA